MFKIKCSKVVSSHLEFSIAIDNDDYYDDSLGDYPGKQDDKK